MILRVYLHAHADWYEFKHICLAQYIAKWLCAQAVYSLEASSFEWMLSGAIARALLISFLQ